MNSSQSPLHLSSCYCSGYRFWGPYRFAGFCGNQHHLKPKSSQIYSKRSRKSIEELFCWFQMLRNGFTFLSFWIHLHTCSFIFLSCACIFLSFCMHFLSYSFHVPFICVHILSSPFMFIPMCIRFFSYSFHLHACSLHFALIPFMSFHLLSFAFICVPKFWNRLYGLARGASATNGHR